MINIKPSLYFQKIVGRGWERIDCKSYVFFQGSTSTIFGKMGNGKPFTPHGKREKEISIEMIPLAFLL